MFTPFQLDAWFILQTFTEAHLAVGVFFCVLCKLLMNQHTVLVETGQTGVFIAKTFACVVAPKNLIAALLHQSLAIVIRTDIYKSRALWFLTFLHNAATKSTLHCLFVKLVLFAGLANVVRSGLAAAAELFTAVRTVSTILAHVDGCFLWDNFSVVIFIADCNLTLVDYNLCSTAAPLDSNSIHHYYQLLLFYFFSFLLGQVQVHFVLSNLDVAYFALDGLRFTDWGQNLLLKALPVHRMETLRWFNHYLIVVFVYILRTATAFSVLARHSDKLRLSNGYYLYFLLFKPPSFSSLRVMNWFRLGIIL